MPATTPNRFYPYPLPADPTDIPGDMQRLAEAIDDDVCALTDAVTGRPVSKFRGTEAFASLTTSLGSSVGTVRLPWDTTDFNLVPCTMQSQEVGNRLIKPEVPGFYFATASLQVPTLTLAGTVNVLILQIRRGNAALPLNVASFVAGVSHRVPVGADDQGVRLMTVSAGMFMNGTTDAWSIEFFADTTPDVAEYIVNERSLTVMRMTQS